MDTNSIPGLTLSPSLDAKLNALDDNLQPLEKEEVKSEDVPTEETTKEDDTAPQAEEEQEVDESEEAGDDSEESSDEESTEPADDDDSAYTIDEGDDEDVQAEPAPTTSTQAGPNQFTAEQQYILDNIAPIKIRGDVGGETKEFEILTPDQLPAGFKFLDDRDMALATKAFAMLEQKAEQLQNDFRNQETNKAAKEFKQKEDDADRQDIGALQRSGDLPKFTVAPTDAKFEQDPNVQLVQDILDFKEAQNQKYFDEYQAGRPYKHIGFEEAFRMFKREQPAKANKAQVKEDAERKNVAKRTTGSKSNKADAPRPRTVLRSSRDIDSFIENLDW